eukprot:124594-Chlamydomonas_euryale.AAC.2
MQSEITKHYIKRLRHDVDTFRDASNTKLLCLAMRDNVVRISGKSRVRIDARDVYRTLGNQKLRFQLIARL